MIRFRNQHGYDSEALACFLQPQGTVLEVGCGEGRNLIFIANKGLKVVGVDINAEYIRKANLAILAVQADANKLPFKDSSFDRILCSEVLEHLVDPSSCISECHRVLKNAGTAVFACPTLNIPLKVLVPAYRKLAGIPKHSYQEHIHVFNAKQLIVLLRNYFEIVEVKYVEFLSVFERRFRVGYSLERTLSSASTKIVPLRYLAGGGWFKVRKVNR